MAKIKAGIIGFGLAGRNMHYKALVEGLSNMVDVIAICTRRPITREATNPDDFPIHDTVALYTDIDEFLAHPGLETVHITTPSGLHRDSIVKAAQAGKHVVCDKPLEITVAKIDESIEACRKAGVALSVNFQQRYNPHVAKLKNAIDKGFLGDIVAGIMEAKLYRQPEYYTESSWHGKFDLDGGAALMNQGIHYIDLIQWLMKSPPVEVRKGIAQRILHTYIEAEDFGYGEIVLENGAELTILGGTCFRPGIDQRFEIRGTGGCATIVDGVVTQAYWDCQDQREYFGRVDKVEFSGGAPMMGLDNHERYFRAFYTALKTGGDIPVSGEEARVSVELILGIYKAQETGGAVRFPIEPGYKPGF